jgi:hypothetical protein
MMLGSLQRIEGTLKLMLNLEYERALAFQQADVQQNLIEGDTDPVPDDPEAGPGRFRRGLSSARGMLGGAYGKLKGSSIIKLLGLGALIFALNKYRDEIIAATASILKYFNDVYDVFKSEGLGAAFDKIVDDFKNIFLPKIQNMSMSLLDFIWGAVKGVVVDWVFGAKGDIPVREQAEKSATTKSTLSNLNKKLAVGQRDESMFNITGTVSKDFMAANPNLDDAAAQAMRDEQKRLIMSMVKISKASNGRIQFSGIPFDSLHKNIRGSEGGLLNKLTPNMLANANPIVDGIFYDNWDILKDIRLGEMAGITKGMDKDQVKKIEDALEEKTLLAKQYADEKSSTYETAGLVEQGKSAFNPEAFELRKGRRLDDLKIKIAANQKLFDDGYLNQVFPDADVNFATPGDTKPKEEIKKLSGRFADMEKQFKQRYLPDGTLARPLTLADQKTINNVNASENNFLPMSSGKTSWSAMLYANAGTVYNQSN